MTVEVAGTWELGWSAPMTEMDLWWSVMRAYDIPLLHMTPISGLNHKMLREHTSWDELLDEARDLTPVFVDETAEGELADFTHPQDALYVFGKQSQSPIHAYGKDAPSFHIDMPKMGMLWPHQCVPLIMRDRERKA